MHFLLLTVREVLAGVFGLAVLGKLRARSDWRAFVTSLTAMRVATTATAPSLAIAVVVAEAATCVLLVLPGVPAAGEGSAAIMLGSLTVVVARVVGSGRRVSCGCFGRTTVALSVRHVVRNGALAALAVAAGMRELAAQAPAFTDAGLPVAILATATAALAVVLITRLDDLVWALSPHPR
jgi:methylamine utilization protein MauE